MAGELVRWKPNQAALQKIETALRIARGERGIQKHGPGTLGPPSPPPAALPARITRPEIVDLTRICSVHDKPYASRYVLQTGGHYRYGRPIAIDQGLYRFQYEDNLAGGVVPAADIEDEKCPWCGASGRGAVRCSNCKVRVCYGRTMHRTFRCRPSCGNVGPTVAENVDEYGVDPGQ